jgi:hypothetical protein
MSKTTPLTIDCEPHGTRIATVVCGHMMHTKGPVGFVENSSDPNDLQAWCHDCELLFEQEQGLTETFRQFTEMTIVCDRCYADLKARHSRTD